MINSKQPLALFETMGGKLKKGQIIWIDNGNGLFKADFLGFGHEPQNIAYNGMSDDTDGNPIADFGWVNKSKVWVDVQIFGKNEIPRRNRIDQLHPSEYKLYEAGQEIETLGASELLTSIVVDLNNLRNKLADHFDGI